MEKNNGSNSSMCRRIRRAIETSPPIRAFRRAFCCHQSRPAANYSDSPLSSPPVAARTTATSSIQNKPHYPRHLKDHNEGAAGVVPINFEYSSPTSSGFANSATSGAVKNKPRPGASRGELAYQGQRTKLDINDTFGDYIQRTRRRIRTVSNVGAGDQSYSESSDEANGGARMEDQQKDQFSVFIQHAKRKIRTTSSVGGTSSLKRG